MTEPIYNWIGAALIGIPTCVATYWLYGPSKPDVIVGGVPEGTGFTITLSFGAGFLGGIIGYAVTDGIQQYLASRSSGPATDILSMYDYSMALYHAEVLPFMRSLGERAQAFYGHGKELASGIQNMVHELSKVYPIAGRLL